jgi:hypothetical protein
MLQTIFNTIVTSIIGIVLGYCVSKIKDYKKKAENNKDNENLQNIALQNLLRSQLTSIYFVYGELKQIPDYVYQNFLDLLGIYEKLGGNSYIHTIAKKMETWEIIKTDIL